MVLSSIIKFFSSPPPPQAAPPLPAVRGDHRRHRGLSWSAVTELPPHLPTLKDIHMDVVEYIAHICLHQSQLDKLMQHVQDLETALTLLSGPPPTHGRLFSRLRLTAVYRDVCAKAIGSVEAAADGDPMDVSAVEGEVLEETLMDLSAARWKDLEEDLILLKSQLLRRDANVADYSDAPPNDEIDAVLDAHFMMRDDFYQVQRLLQIQHALAALRERVTDLEAQRPIGLARSVTAAVEDYELALASIFPETAAAVVPEELAAMRPLLYTQSRQVDRILKHISDIVLDDTKVYSHANLQAKWRALLIQWSEKILEIPELYQRGYGNVHPTTVVGSQGEVSSMEEEVEEEEEEDEPLATQAVEPLPVTRVAAKRFSEAEREILQQFSQQSDDDNDGKPPAKKRRVDEQENQVPHDDDESSATEDPAHAPAPAPRPPVRPTPPTKNPSPRMVAIRRPLEAIDVDDSSDDDESVEKVSPHDQPKKKGSKRTPFTQEEVEAIKQGVARFGVGKWRIIKDHSGGRLDHRTPAQIKDKYRNMVRTNQI